MTMLSGQKRPSSHPYYDPDEYQICCRNGVPHVKLVSERLNVDQAWLDGLNSVNPKFHRLLWITTHNIVTEDGDKPHHLCACGSFHINQGDWSEDYICRTCLKVQDPLRQYVPKYGDKLL